MASLDIVLSGTGSDESDESQVPVFSENAEPLTELLLQKFVVAAQAGDTEAFGAVYDHFFLPIYRYASFRAPSELVEDLVADIFVKAWEKLHLYKVRRGVPFAAWLFRIARHTIIDAYRSQRFFEEVPEELPDHDVFNQTETKVRRNDLVRIVREALDKLPKRYREVLLLSFVSELSHAEVARTLRISEGGVRILKFRALRKLEGFLPPDIRDSA